MQYTRRLAQNAALSGEMGRWSGTLGEAPRVRHIIGFLLCRAQRTKILKSSFLECIFQNTYCKFVWAGWVYLGNIVRDSTPHHLIKSYRI